MIHQTTPTEVKNWLEIGTKKVVLDVREASEVSQGKIPGALNIPLGLLSFRTQELDKRSEYIVVCLSGGRSMMASELLSSQGFVVYNMQGGMGAWDGKIE